VVAVHPGGRWREAVGEEVDEEVGEVRTRFEGLEKGRAHWRGVFHGGRVEWWGNSDDKLKER
jgi:hypothetical protein